MLPPPGLEAATQYASPTASALAAAVTATSANMFSINIVGATSTLAVLAGTASATSAKSPHDKPEENGECELLGPFAIVVQGALGVLALLSLVYKRWRERPQRPLKIWSFDVSKQVVGSVLVHIANLLMSLLSSGKLDVQVAVSDITRRAITLDGFGALIRRGVDVQEKYQPNPCSFYLLNLAIDTTVGIPILIVLLRVLTALFSMTPFGSPPESIVSGNYGSPPKATWWFKQSIIYFIGLMGMKFCVLIIFLLAPWISRVGDWALRWTEGDVALQVIFVMLVFPVIMNATQYYIIDSFIKHQTPGGHHEQIPGDDPDDAFDAARDAVAYAESISGGSDADDEQDQELLAKAKGRKDRPQRSSNSVQKLQTGMKDYDPLLDGESSPTTVVGSASTSKGLDDSDR